MLELILHYLFGHHIVDRLKRGFEIAKNIKLSESVDNLSSNYYHHSLFEVGKLEDKYKNYEVAKTYFEKVEKLTDKRKSINKESKKILKAYKKMK